MRKKVLLTAFCVALLVLAGTSFAEEPSGEVTIDEYQLAFIFNGSMGGGKLYFQGNTYDFQIGGLGIGGFGASHISASGAVYNLRNVADFPGAYGQASVGFSATNVGQGQLWMQNQNGVRLHLWTTQQGLALSAAADGVVINMSK